MVKCLGQSPGFPVCKYVCVTCVTVMLGRHTSSLFGPSINSINYYLLVVEPQWTVAGTGVYIYI